jgi:phospholipid/cholesterol/gamma-HCH transport system substrate-binding protein
MQKQAPSIGRILIALGFTLSCFGLILFLWIAFGGPTPLKPKSYRISAYFPEATQLAQESDVRIGGVSVGKVKELTLAPPDQRVNGNDTTQATIEIEPQFAPISSDARAILRQKTLLGETFVELTSGTEASGEEEEGAPVALGAAANVADAEAESVDPIEEGGTLGIAQTQDQTQIDEIFNALDEETRTSFQRWMANAATAIDQRGLDLNDALGNLGPFVTDASEVVEVLERQKVALKGLVHDTGTVFEALTEQDQALARAITGSNNTFNALAREDEALAESFQILPTFERESRATFERLDEFQLETRPLVQDLIPVANDLSPTLRSVRRLAPNLKRLFKDLDVLIDVSAEGLPAAGRTLDGLSPVLEALDPFLANFNPVLDYLEFQKGTITDFLAGPGVALAGSVNPVPGQPAARHYLRQLGYVGAETLGVWPSRLPANRGNGYLAPGALSNFSSAKSGIFPNFDCRNPDYHVVPPTQEGDAQAQDEEFLKAGKANPNDDVHGGKPVSPTFAPCVLEDWYPKPDAPNFGGSGDFPTSNFGNTFGEGRFPQLFIDP